MIRREFNKLFETCARCNKEYIYREDKEDITQTIYNPAVQLPVGINAYSDFALCPDCRANLQTILKLFMLNKDINLLKKTKEKLVSTSITHTIHLDTKQRNELGIPEDADGLVVIEFYNSNEGKLVYRGKVINSYIEYLHSLGNFKDVKVDEE